MLKAATVAATLLGSTAAATSSAASEKKAFVAPKMSALSHKLNFATVKEDMQARREKILALPGNQERIQATVNNHALKKSSRMAAPLTDKKQLRSLKQKDPYGPKRETVFWSFYFNQDCSGPAVESFALTLNTCQLGFNGEDGHRMSMMTLAIDGEVTVADHTNTGDRMVQYWYPNENCAGEPVEEYISHWSKWGDCDSGLKVSRAEGNIESDDEAAILAYSSTVDKCLDGQYAFYHAFLPNVCFQMDDDLFFVPEISGVDFDCEYTGEVKLSYYDDSSCSSLLDVEVVAIKDEVCMLDLDWIEGMVENEYSDIMPWNSGRCIFPGSGLI